MQLEGGSDASAIVYSGRTQEAKKRSSAHKSSYTLRGSYIPNYTTLHVAFDCTLIESMAAEYIGIQLKGLRLSLLYNSILVVADIFSDYPGRPYNVQMPYPYIPHSQESGPEHAAENLAIHSKGRRLVADLVLDAISLWNKKGDSELIEMEVVI
jgi:hypothetical protein